MSVNLSAFGMTRLFSARAELLLFLVPYWLDAREANIRYLDYLVANFRVTPITMKFSTEDNAKGSL